MTKPPIVFYTHTLGMGGGTRVIATLANLLSAAGYSVRVVAVNRDDNPQRKWFSKQVDVHVFSGGNRWSRMFELFRSLRKAQGVVFPCCEFSSLLIPVFQLLRPKRFALVIVAHVDLGRLLESETDKVALRWGMRFARWSYARADVVAAVSCAAASELQKRLRLDNVEVLYNPVVDAARVRKFHPPIPEWMASLPRPILLNAGRLHPQKDQVTLMRAFSTLEAGTLVILGEGPCRYDLERLAQQLGLAARVRIPGNVDNPLDCMYHSDLFVLSSRYEGLPTVLIEAMSVGCAVVSTDCPAGPREILDSGRFGGLVPVGDVEALSKAMRQALQAPTEASELQAKASEYSYENSIARYISVVQKLMEKS